MIGVIKLNLYKRLIEGLKKEIMKKAIFAPESSREFQKRLNDLINAAENLNKTEMKTPLERIELAEKELKAAKEALQPKVEYVEIISCKSELSWYSHRISEIFEVSDVYDKYYYKATFDSCKIIRIDECKPSTKEAFDKQNEIIRVPDCIKFTETYRREIGIAFNNNKQSLSYFNGFYNVENINNKISDGSNFKLTKCERSDLKAGDVAFRTDYSMNGKNTTYFFNYCIILDHKLCVYAEDMNCTIETENYNHWYKVEKI